MCNHLLKPIVFLLQFNKLLNINTLLPQLAALLLLELLLEHIDLFFIAFDLEAQILNSVLLELIQVLHLPYLEV